MRQALRLRRAELSAAERAAAARTIALHIARTRWLRAGRPVGLYASVGTEVSSWPLRILARRRCCPIYLPRIFDYRRGRMLFARDDGGGALNRYGIFEPASLQNMRPFMLAVVFVPVLGFDARGTRLGSGAGYYDRLFAFAPHRSGVHRPLLVGLAFHCQELARIDAEAHDVPLDAVVTEAGVALFSHRGVDQ